MDNKLKDVVYEEVFQWSPGSRRQSGCMHRSFRKSWLMPPARVSKGKAKADETVVEDDEVLEDEA
jgi:hypothetical protein